MTPDEFYRLNRLAHPFYKFLKNGDIPEDIMLLKSDHIKELVFRNHAIGISIQEHITTKETPQEGDKVLINGQPLTIHIRPYEIMDGFFQFQAGIGQSHYRSKDGGGSYSGTCGEQYQCKGFIDTGLYLESLGWFFANNEAQGNNALFYRFNVKLWEITK